MQDSGVAHGDGRGGLTFTTWNVKGVNDPVKRGKVLAHLKSLSSDIMFLQETHLEKTSQSKLRSRWIGQLFQSSFSTKTRGVAILIRKGVPFKQQSTISDTDGRFIIVKGEIHSFPITLVNIYGPNFDNPAFFRKVFSLITDISQTNLIVGGDLNCTLCTYMDSSSKRQAPHSNTRDFLNAYMKNSNLADVWRFFNPSGRDYSFHSHVHNVYTRIDYLLVDAKLLPHIHNPKYHNILISDHSPVTFILNVNGLKPSRPLWRMNPQLINDPTFCVYTRAQLKMFFETNDTPETSPCLLWETLKAFLRGCIISFMGARNKKNRAKLMELEKQIHDLDKENARHPSMDIYKQILELRIQYNQITSAKISKSFLFLKQRYFEFGEKPQKLLARQLRKLESDRTIHKIKSEQGTPLTSLKDINNRFKEFYEVLYSSKTNAAPGDMEHFLDQINLPSLTQRDNNLLNKDITITEIIETIKTLNGGKTPGPDGLPCELYKEFADILAPYMLKMYSLAFKNKSLPQSLSEAVITLIPKKGKDPEDVGGYRPISLLNVDQKILSKILANRLNTFMDKLAYRDQTGFIPGRNSSTNLRRLFDIMYNSDPLQKDLVVASLDAEKAFDQIEWDYLFEVLKRFNLGDTFISWIKLLYNNPTAQILTNGVLSSRFELFRSTRQGCPLSPILFALAIEPLAESIRTDPTIHGVECAGSSDKISLYADDVLLFITKPQISLPAILNKINQFGKFSGYRINWTKSELMPVSLEDLSEIERLPFKISLQTFTYLGIQVTKDFSSLFKANYPPLLAKLKNNIQFWRSLPLSLIGRINTIKMMFLPQILYLFQCLPVFLPKSFFKSLDSTVLPFIWDYKRHRIKKTHLCKPKQVGGLALPDFCLYYWSSNMKIISAWLDNSVEAPRWLQLERERCRPYCLKSILLSPTTVDKSFYNKCPVIHSMTKTWKQVKTYFGNNTLSLLLPIAGNPSFPPGQLDYRFSLWKDLGIRTIGDLYIEEIFASFAQLQEKYGLPRSNFHLYLQIRDYVRKSNRSFARASYSALDKFLLQNSQQDMRISHFYESLQHLKLPTTTAVRLAWENELGVQISDELWENSLEEVNTCSINSRHCLIQFRVIHRLHYSKSKLHKIYPDVSPNCDKCKATEATLLHSFALCPLIQRYWIKIFEALSDILDTHIDPDPILIILGVSDPISTLTRAQRHLLSYGLITAKKLILTHWKKEEAPAFKHWLNEMTSTLHLERIRYSLKNREAQFDKIWLPLVRYLSRRRT